MTSILALSIGLWSTVFVLAAALYLLGMILYRICLHPLAKYPGPFFAKSTDLFIAYHAWKGDCHLEYWKCHEKYGRIVRFGPNSLSFNSNTALREIYGHKTSTKKGDFYSTFWATGTQDTASMHSSIDRARYARKRRVLSQGFSDTALKAMETHILEYVKAFCQSLIRSAHVDVDGFHKPIDLARQSNYLTFDIVGSLSFGTSFRMLESADNHFAIDLIANATHRHYICGWYPALHRLGLDKLLFHKIAAGRAQYMQYSRAQAASRMQSEAERKDFFYYLLNARDPETGQGFIKTELLAESNSLIIAGSDTTSTALSATLFYLLHSDKALTRVTQEVRSAFSDVDEIKIGPTLSSVHFLRACIDEALRLAPPVGGLLPRETTVDTIIDGEHIPEGTIVGVPHYTIHHNPACHPNAFEYMPDRWIKEENSAEAVALAHSAFCPFSIGTRACIGKGLAYHEWTLTLARMLFLYDVRFAPGQEDLGHSQPQEYQLKDTFTSVKQAPLVQVRRRSGI